MEGMIESLEVRGLNHYSPTVDWNAYYNGIQHKRSNMGEERTELADLAPKRPEQVELLTIKQPITISSFSIPHALLKACLC